MLEKEVAIIDLGSNTVKLVIYHRHKDGRFHEAETVKQVLRLSGHLQDGRFDDAGIRKTLACMRQFREILAARQVAKTLGVATAAFRQAENGRELARRIEAETGIHVEILSGEEEARYGFLAVVNSVNVSEGLTVDIGGGSTEITYFENRRLKFWTSLPIGVVNLTKRFLPGDPPGKEELDQLDRFIREQLSKYGWIRDRRCPVIAIGGTARNLARIHQRQQGYTGENVHHYRMTPEQVTEIFAKMSVLPCHERSRIPGISKDRADVILSGIAVLQNLLEMSGSDCLLFCNKGLRDGVMYAKSR